jgi:uncharacterized repeat protein (TIGR01451 family)
MNPRIHSRGAAALALAALGAIAPAQEAAADGTRLASATPATPAAAAPSRAGCIELKTVAETEETVVDPAGERRTRLVPAAKVVPGDEVVWTITAANVCQRAAERVLVDNPVPQHMTYVPGSAAGAGSQVQFSLDGARYAAPEALQVKAADGTTRAARADEYTHIRWNFANAIAPGQVAIARFRATLK